MKVSPVCLKLVFISFPLVMMSHQIHAAYEKTAQVSLLSLLGDEQPVFGSVAFLLLQKSGLRAGHDVRPDFALLEQLENQDPRCC